MRRRLARAALVCAGASAAMFGCRMFVSLDGLDDGARLAPDANGVDAPSDRATSAESGDGSATATSDAAPMPQVVRQGTDVTGSIRVSVAGQYEIQFTQASSWQPGRWLDLLHSSSENLAGTPIFVEPWVVEYFGSWIFPGDGTRKYARQGEENRVRVEVQTHFHIDPPADAGLNPPTDHLSIEGSYWFYATGRVAVRQDVVNSVPGVSTLTNSEYAHTSVSSAMTWDVREVLPGQAIGFTRAGGPAPASRLLVVNTSDETMIDQNRPTNRYWSAGPHTIPDGGSIERTWTILLTTRGLSDAALTEIAEDARTPGIEALADCDLAGTGFDFGEGAYRVVATGPRVQLRLTNALARHSPSFVVEDWPSTAYTIKLGGATIVSSAQDRTPQGIASYDSATKRLVFSYAGVIDRAAGDAERTFTIE